MGRLTQKTKPLVVSVRAVSSGLSVLVSDHNIQYVSVCSCSVSPPYQLNEIQILLVSTVTRASGKSGLELKNRNNNNNLKWLRTSRLLYEVEIGASTPALEPTTASE